MALLRKSFEVSGILTARTNNGSWMNMNEQIKVYPNNSREIIGVEIADGYMEAYNVAISRRGVVKVSTGVFKVTFPLNGHRARNLAEAVTGERTTAVWEIGKAMIVPLKDLQDLPGFDLYYIKALDALEEIGIFVVTIQVVIVDPTYGVHITVGVAEGGNAQ